MRKGYGTGGEAKRKGDWSIDAPRLKTMEQQGLSDPGARGTRRVLARKALSVVGMAASVS